AGWVKPSNPSAKQPAKPTAIEFQLPCLQILSASAVENWVRLAATDGMTLEASEIDGMTPLPDSRVHAADVAYFTSHARYNGTFRVQRTPNGNEARTLTLVEIRGRQLSLRTIVEVRVAGDDARTVTLELRNWPGSDAQCEVLEGGARVHRDAKSKTPTWNVE